MGSNPVKGGRLEPGRWKTVLTGWGYYSGTYRTKGDAFPLEARFRPIGGTQILREGQVFVFSAVGYAELAFRSAHGGLWSIMPLVLPR